MQTCYTLHMIWTKQAVAELMERFGWDRADMARVLDTDVSTVSRLLNRPVVTTERRTIQFDLLNEVADMWFGEGLRHDSPVPYNDMGGA